MNKFQTKINAHEDVCRELNDIYAKKNVEHDDAFAKSFKEYGVILTCIKAEDKLNELKNLTIRCTSSGSDIAAVKNAVKDLANYAIMTLVDSEQAEEGLKNGQGN